MAKGTVKLILGNAEQEESSIRAILAQVMQKKASLFLGYFLSDLPQSEVMPSTKNTRIVLRQYGHSCYVNACPALADVRRIEIGLEEAEHALRSGEYDTVLLGQILTAVESQLLTAEDIIALMDKRPEHVTLILTGNSAPAAILEKCE